MTRGQLITVGVASVAVLGVIGFMAMRRADVLPSKETFNPLSPENLAYRGVNAVGEALTGDRDFSLGVWLWEQTHSEPDLTAPIVPAGPLSAEQLGLMGIAPSSSIAPYFAP
jgi:hypothetical protein